MTAAAKFPKISREFAEWVEGRYPELAFVHDKDHIIVVAHREELDYCGKPSIPTVDFFEGVSFDLYHTKPGTPLVEQQWPVELIGEWARPTQSEKDTATIHEAVK